jgi:hypothetical protein
LPAPKGIKPAGNPALGPLAGASDCPRAAWAGRGELLAFGGGQRREELALLLVADPRGCRLGALAADVYQGLEAVGWRRCSGACYRPCGGRS